MMYIPRTLEKFFGQVNKQYPVLLMTGPRQVGKTTLLNHLQKEERHYVTLDNPIMATAAKEDPAGFLERFPPPILIDEIQYAPELLPYIKMYVDTNKKPGSFWLTGSQQFHMMKNVSESLAGRVGIVQLLGLSLWEQYQHALDVMPFLPTKTNLQSSEAFAPNLSLLDFYKIIWRGSMPAIVLDSTLDRDFFYGSYLNTYLQRDVRDLAQVGNQTGFLKFLRVAAARTGQVLNLSDMARDADISPVTAKSWLSILQASNLIYLLEPYHTNLTKRMIKAPKLYFLDTGLCSYLTDWITSENLEAGAMSGAIFETFIVSEIIKSYWHNGKRAPIFYYRDKDKQEIDLLIIQNQKIYPMEIKKTASPKKQMIDQFRLLDKLNLEREEGGLICLTHTFLPLGEKDHIIPGTFVA